MKQLSDGSWHVPLGEGLTDLDPSRDPFAPCSTSEMQMPEDWLAGVEAEPEAFGGDFLEDLLIDPGFPQNDESLLVRAGLLDGHMRMGWGGDGLEEREWKSSGRRMQGHLSARHQKAHLHAQLCTPPCTQGGLFDPPRRGLHRAAFSMNDLQVSVKLLQRLPPRITPPPLRALPTTPRPPTLHPTRPSLPRASRGRPRPPAALGTLERGSPPSNPRWRACPSSAPQSRSPSRPTPTTTSSATGSSTWTQTRLGWAARRRAAAWACSTRLSTTAGGPAAAAPSAWCTEGSW
jgi:hypothetical protein